MQEKKSGCSEKKKNCVIFQNTFATKSSKDKLKEWPLPSHTEPTKATPTFLMPNSTHWFFGIRP